MQLSRSFAALLSKRRDKVHTSYVWDVLCSRLYHGPFLIDTTVPASSNVIQDLPFSFVTVKAMAVQEGNLDSPVMVSKVFYIQDTTIDTGSIILVLTCVHLSIYPCMSYRHKGPQGICVYARVHVRVCV